jgi:hypothetical protein
MKDSLGFRACGRETGTAFIARATDRTCSCSCSCAALMCPGPAFKEQRCQFVEPPNHFFISSAQAILFAKKIKNKNKTQLRLFSC